MPPSKPHWSEPSKCAERPTRQGIHRPIASAEGKEEAFGAGRRCSARFGRVRGAPRLRVELRASVRSMPTTRWSRTASVRTNLANRTTTSALFRSIFNLYPRHAVDRTHPKVQKMLSSNPPAAFPQSHKPAARRQQHPQQARFGREGAGLAVPRGRISRLHGQTAPPS
jgi:hypothetical protein